jgi:hypothetical protein
MTHVGVIVRYGGRPFILEQHQFGDAPPGYPDEDGPHFYPLEVRLATKRWALYYAKYEGPPVTTDLSWATKPVYVPYNYSYIKNEAMCHALFKIPRVNTSQKMHCGNYAAWALKKMGVLSPKVRHDCLTPLVVKSLGPYADLQKITTI